VSRDPVRGAYHHTRIHALVCGLINAGSFVMYPSWAAHSQAPASSSFSLPSPPSSATWVSCRACYEVPTDGGAGARAQCSELTRRSEEHDRPVNPMLLHRSSHTNNSRHAHHANQVVPARVTCRRVIRTCLPLVQGGHSRSHADSPTPGNASYSLFSPNTLPPLPWV
jgi:hypothetical protein